MKTTLDSGEPYDISDLLSTFGQRIRSLDTIADAATDGEDEFDVARALAVGLAQLRDDYDQLERALDPAIDREIEARAATARKESGR